MWIWLAHRAGLSTQTARRLVGPMFVRQLAWGGIFLLWGLACDTTTSPRPSLVSRSPPARDSVIDVVPIRESKLRLPAPVADVGEWCADVGKLRICWGEDKSCVGGVCVVPRTIPSDAGGAEAGFRCVGLGKERVCASRQRPGAAFECKGDVCVQRSPYLPDEGEWDCAVLGGISVCVGGERPAGVMPTGKTPGWLCGKRSGVGDSGTLGVEICLDLSPEFPDNDGGGWVCHFSAEQGIRKVCRRGQEKYVSEACQSPADCIAGTRCVSSYCLPPRPTPNCYLPRDCPSGRCEFGTCRGGAP